jgi:ABC-type protease/lipase transport system fused ATPase/permease subunit
VTTIVVSRLPGLMHITDHLLMLNDGRVQFLRPRAEIEPFLALRVAPDRPRVAEGGAS